MRKVGMIDYYLDEWHANHIDGWLKEASNGRYGIALAWGKIDNPKGKTNEEWSKEHNIPLGASIQEVVDSCDVLMVMSPDNPEFHEELCSQVLGCGKPTYVDKTFAPDVATAKKIFAMAEEGNTPMFSTSSLRFSEEFKNIRRDGITVVRTGGPGVWSNYSIHQLEMIVALLGGDVKRVMYTGDKQNPVLNIEFAGGRYGSMAQFNVWNIPFNVSIGYNEGESVYIPDCTRTFENFALELVDFFETGDIKVSKAETIAVAALIEAGRNAAKTPGVWIAVEK